MQGWRENMEDAHICIPHLQHRNDMALFGVMDGHGGEQVARFCKHHLPGEIDRQSTRGDLSASLVASFLQMDRMLANPRYRDELNQLTRDQWSSPSSCQPDSVGCAANICCVQPNGYVVANTGDCRAVLCRNGQAVDLSQDHKPNHPNELSRIRNAGGFLVERGVGDHKVYRVNGDLSLSRAIGDLKYKQNAYLSPHDQLITATPDVRTVQRHHNDEFIVIACDGIWDVLTSQQVVDHVRMHMSELRSGRMRPSAITEEVLDRCLSPDLEKTAGLGGDNMTMMVIFFVQAPDKSPARL